MVAAFREGRNFELLFGAEFRDFDVLTDCTQNEIRQSQSCRTLLANML